MKTFKGNYRKILTEEVRQITWRSLKHPVILSLGAGSTLKTELALNPTGIFAIEWSDSRVRKLKKLAEDTSFPVIGVVKLDMKDVPMLVGKGNDFNTVTMFDSIEHLIKEDALRLLDYVETIVDNVYLFVPIQQSIWNLKGMIDKQRVCMEKNLSMGHHLSMWKPEEFEKRGYKVWVNMGYHPDKDMGAMLCIKEVSK